MIRAHQERQREIDLQLNLLTITHRWHEEEDSKYPISLKDIRIAFANIIQKVVNGQNTPFFYQQKQGSIKMDTEQVKPGEVIGELLDKRTDGLSIQTIQGDEQPTEARLSEIYMQADEFVRILQLAGETDIPIFAIEAVKDADDTTAPVRSHLSIFRKKDLTPYEIGCLYEGIDPRDIDIGYGHDPLTGTDGDVIRSELIKDFGKDTPLSDYAHIGWDSGMNDYEVENQAVTITDLIQWLQLRDFTDNGFLEWLNDKPLPQTDTSSIKQITQLQDQLERARKELGRTASENDKLKAELSEQKRQSSHEHTKQADETQELQDQLLDASTRRGNLERKIDDLETDLLEAKQTIEQLKAAPNNLEQDLSNIAKHVEQCRAHRAMRILADLWAGFDPTEDKKELQGKEGAYTSKNLGKDLKNYPESIGDMSPTDCETIARLSKPDFLK